MPSNPALPEAVQTEAARIVQAMFAGAPTPGEVVSAIAPLIIEWARKDALPEGAKFFPTEGGIMFGGKVYYPADYVLTRTDVEAIRRDQAEARPNLEPVPSDPTIEWAREQITKTITEVRPLVQARMQSARSSMPMYVDDVMALILGASKWLDSFPTPDETTGGETQ